MRADVRVGSIASIPPCPRHVCLSPNSNRYADILHRQLRAISRSRLNRPYGVLDRFLVLPCVSLRQVGMLLRAEPGWTCPDMEVEICGRYGKSPVESDLGIIGAAKLAECFKFQNQDNRKIKFGQIARRWISALPETNDRVLANLTFSKESLR
jgi:hypothetical protein